MDAALYKDVTTSRGIKYHYYYSPAAGVQPTLLFCHGFPSTSQDWRRIVPFFKEKGYGIIAPDMLGYGGTDKPTDPAAYVSSALTKDIVDILDAEKIDKVIAVGHDWGTRPVGRLSNYYPERVIAYAFLAVPYTAPSPLEINVQTLLEMTRKLIGYETFGYWLFLDQEDANEIIQEHIESFVSILFPSDPSIWKDRVAVIDGLKNSLLENYTAPIAPYLSEAEKQEFIKTFREGGFQGPTCWYKVLTQHLSQHDDQQIPADRKFPPVSAPLFFGGALYDRVCLAALGAAAFKKEELKNHQITLTAYEADHWLIFSHADAVSKDLEAWIQGFSTQKSNI